MYNKSLKIQINSYKIIYKVRNKKEVGLKMSNVIEKLIEEVFPDFQNGGNLKKAVIKKVNLYKKTNRFEILLKSDNAINIKDVHNFEVFSCLL